MKLSVCLIAYNHESFIAESLDSILMQQTSFPFEIIIGEDGSKDATRAICENYQQNFPGRIKLLPLQSNKGMLKNLIDTLSACDGELVAFIEGDDYWTDPLKLEKQAGFLCSNPDFSICFHNVLVKFMRKNENAEKIFHQHLPKDIFTTEDLLKQWFIPSASVMFRKYADFTFPDWFSNCKSGDIPFLLLLSLRGNIKYLDEVMSIYRVHDQGVSASHNGYEKIIAMIYIYECFNIHTQFKFHHKIREAERYEIDRHYPGPAVEKMEKEPIPAPGLLTRLLKKVNLLPQRQNQ